MSNYETIAQIRVNEALQEGLESQRAFRGRTKRPSRLKGILKSVARFAKMRTRQGTVNDTGKISSVGKRVEA